MNKRRDGVRAQKEQRIGRKKEERIQK